MENLQYTKKWYFRGNILKCIPRMTYKYLLSKSKTCLKWKLLNIRPPFLVVTPSPSLGILSVISLLPTTDYMPWWHMGWQTHRCCCRREFAHKIVVLEPLWYYPIWRSMAYTSSQADETQTTIWFAYAWVLLGSYRFFRKTSQIQSGMFPWSCTSGMS